MSVIRIEGLSKTFYPGFRRRPVEAVRGLSMTVEPQEIFGFLGPNGAGKTTTIKILTGLIQPTGGSATLFDEPVGSHASRRRLGYMPEAPYFYDYLTGIEFMDLMGRLCDVPKSVRATRSRELLDLVGLSHAMTWQLRRYSKGMLQRAGIAQALIHDPELVLLDEPMTGLDPIGRKEIRNLILSLRDQKKTVMFSTHILADVEMVCDRVAIIHRGQLATLGPLDDLMARTRTSTEIACRGLDEAGRNALAELSSQELVQVGERTLVYVSSDQSAVDAVIEAIRTGGGHILWVTPVRQGLEEIFMDTVGS